MKIKLNKDAFIDNKYCKAGEIIDYPNNQKLPSYAVKVAEAKKVDTPAPQGAKLDKLKESAKTLELEVLEEDTIETLAKKIADEEKRLEELDALKKEAQKLEIKLTGEESVEDLKTTIETKRVEKEEFDELVKKATKLNISVRLEDTIETLAPQIEAAEELLNNGATA